MKRIYRLFALCLLSPAMQHLRADHSDLASDLHNILSTTIQHLRADSSDLGPDLHGNIPPTSSLFSVELKVNEESTKGVIDYLCDKLNEFLKPENNQKLAEIGNSIALKISPVINRFLKVSTALGLTGVGGIVTLYGLHTAIKVWIKERHEQDSHIKAKYRDQRIYYTCLTGLAAGVTGICLYMLQQRKAAVETVQAVIQNVPAPSLG